MANMFSGNLEKRIPKNLKECYETDNVTYNLWVWCERLEKWGFRICIVLAIIGILSIVSNGIEAGQEYGIEIKTVFEVVVEGIIIWSLYCFLEYCAYHILALLVGSLATIVQHTKITANIALYNAANAEGISKDFDNMKTDDNADNKNGKWKNMCNEKIHLSYISEIEDAYTDSENAHWEFNQSSGTKTLFCNHCGKEIMFINDFVEGEKYKAASCPKCKRILGINVTKKIGKCPFCKMEFDVK